MIDPHLLHEFGRGLVIALIAVGGAIGIGLSIAAAATPSPRDDKTDAP